MVKAKVRRLAIPAALTVTTLGGLPACGDDGDGGESVTPSTTMTSMTSSPMTATMGTTDAITATSTDSGSSAGDSATTTGTSTTGEPLPDCGSAQEEGACQGIEGCRWIFNLGCILECDVISDEATCLMQLDCEWSPADGCRLPDTIETDT